MSYLGYQSLDELDGLRPPLRLTTLIGVVATEFATLEELVVLTTVELATTKGTGTLHRSARERWGSNLRRRPMSQKIEMLELMWPGIWTSFQPLKDRLRKAAEGRNRHAHAFDTVDVMTMIRDGIDPGAGDRALAPYWQIQDGRAKKSVVDLAAIDDVIRDLRQLNEALEAVYFLFFERNIPIDIEWVMRNPVGSHSRVDKPEQDPNFAGWK